MLKGAAQTDIFNKGVEPRPGFQACGLDLGLDIGLLLNGLLVLAHNPPNFL